MPSKKTVCRNSPAEIGRSWEKASWALVVAGVSPLPLAAQSLEEVVISATRSEQRSFDAPAAISVVDRDTIQNGGPQINLSESLNRVPGLTILNRQNYAQDLQLSIRGFGARTPFGIRGIRLLIDGIPATTPDGQGQGSSISLPSTERIEVLRGPLALMYGNSSGGVIQAFTRDAPEVPEFTAQAYTGSFDMRRTAWQYAGRIGDYGLVADYSTFDTNGFRDNSKTQRTQFNGKLSFNPNDQTQVNVVFNQFDMPLAQDPLGLRADELGTPRKAGTNAVIANVRKITSQNQLGSSATYTLDADRSVTARAYYGVRENLQYLAPATLSATRTWVGLNRDYYGAGLQYNEKTSLAGRPVRLVAGYEYDYSTERRQGGTAISGQQVTSQLSRNEDNRAQNSDFFVQATTLATNHISVVTGLRSSNVSLSSQSYMSGPDNTGSVTYRASSPVLGLTYHATDNLNLYANYGQGFETPTLAEVAYTGSGTSPKFNPLLQAASSQHYEIGAKWLPSNTSRVDLTAYQIDSRDEIVVLTSSGGSTSYKNVPGTQRRGLELSANNWLTPHVSALLSSSWIDATFTQSYPNSANVSATGNTVAAGNKMPGIPQHFLFSELLWTSQAMGASKRVAALGTRAGFEWVSAGRLFANDTNVYNGSSASAAGYNVLNAKVSQGWALGNNLLTAYARVDNLIDKQYVGSVIVNQSSGQFYEPAPGRNWTLGLRYSMPM